MRIGRLALGNWKNFAAAELVLLDRAVLIGPNAAGKSNLLDALRFLHDVAAARGGGLQAAVAARRGVEAIGRVGAAPGAGVSLRLELEDGAGGWRYALGFEAGPDGAARLTREEVVRREGARATVLLDRPDAADRDDPERLGQTALEQTAANARFRPLAAFLRSIRHVRGTARRPETAASEGVSEGASEGVAGLIARIAATPGRARTARLARLSEALRLAVPQFDRLLLVPDARGRPHLRARYLHWPEDHPGEDEGAFSSGTLRLLGLLWSLQEQGGPLLIEEPEQSLPAAIAAELPRLIRGAARGRAGRPARQVLIATHSPDLLSDPSLGLDEVFVILPDAEGARVLPASALPGAADRLAAGLPLAEILLPLARPPAAERLGQLDLG